MKVIIKYIFQFIILVLIQVLVLKNFHFLGFIFVNPYIYILFILSLPLAISRFWLLLLAFTLGLTIDIFSDTMGVHAFATTFAAFFRFNIIKLFAPRDNYDHTYPSMKTLGQSQYVKYAIALVLLHHMVLFTIEAFSLAHPFILFLKIILSTCFTLLIILGMEQIKYR